MSKYTFIMVLATLLLIVLVTGCTSKISGDKNASIGRDSQSSSALPQAPTGSVTAKEIDHPFPDEYLGKTLRSGVEYYRDPKSDDTSEQGIVGTPCSVSNDDGLKITFDRVADGEKGTKIVYGSVLLPKNIRDLYVVVFLQYGDDTYSRGDYAESNSTKNLTFVDGDLFKAVITSPNGTGDPKGIAFWATYSFNKTL
jgi:hypothetical protein